MSKSVLWKTLAAVMAISLLLAACGGPAATTQAPATEQPAATAVSEQPTATTAMEEPTATTASEQPTATSESSTASQSSGITLDSGFDCPAPNPKVDVKSTELNLFVWTEYIPQDMLDCFEKVYNIKVNRDEYSSNEEMFAKISKGGTNYDLVQKSDRSHVVL